MPASNAPYPQIPQTVRPTISSPLCDAQKTSLGVSKCGDTVNRAIEIRCPYEGFDGHAWRLNALVGPNEPLDDRNPDLFDRIRVAAETAIAANTTTWGGLIPSGTQAAVEKEARKALEYLDAAEALAAWWENYLPPPGPGFEGGSQFGSGHNVWADESMANRVRGWPIYANVYEGVRRVTTGRSPGFYPYSCTRSGDRTLLEKNQVKYYCPSEDDWNLHDRAKNQIKFLLETAARWARCAQEEAHVSGVYAFNKRDAPKPQRPTGPNIPLGSGLPKPPPEPTPGLPSVRDIAPSEPEGPVAEPAPQPERAPLQEPGPPPEEVPHEEMTPEEREQASDDSRNGEPSPDDKITTPARRPTNVLLYGGAALLAFLLLRKKR